MHIERFRRLENLRLEGLGSVNLLVGKNNCGKTSVLEALAIASNPLSPLNWINTAWERELKSSRTPVLEALNWMFPHMGPRQNGFEATAVIAGRLRTTGDELRLISDSELRIQADYREFREVSLQSHVAVVGDADAESPTEYAAQMKLRLQRRADGDQPWAEECVTHEFTGGKFNVESDRPVLLPHQFVSPVSHRTNRQLLAAVDQVLEDRLKDEVVRLMKLLADDVDDIEIRSPQGQGAVVHLHHTRLGHVPLSVEGDGMRRALVFASAAALAKGGVLLLDEVETALHPDALASIFRFLVQACRATGVQLFVTTHSLEAVDAMLRSVEAEVGGLVAYHLPPRGSSHSAYRLSGESIRSMRTEGGLDLR